MEFVEFWKGSRFLRDSHLKISKNIKIHKKRGIITYFIVYLFILASLIDTFECKSLSSIYFARSNNFAMQVMYIFNL